MKQARQILNNTFGYHDFRHHQADIIHTLIQGGDALVLMPTGGGKSLCYQIPALLRSGAGIIVSPLIALMQDQVDALRQLGLRAAFLNSTQDSATQQATEQALLGGELDLLYVAPERLLSPRMLKLLARAPLALFAIDEAHCVSQWGHDFRPEYRQLSVLAEGFSNVPRIALTATADRRTRDEIIEQLSLGQAEVYINSFDRPNIRYAISEGDNPRERLWRFIEREHTGDAGIVYCLSRKKVEQVADWLTQKGRTALAYHAGLPEQMRREHQTRFLREDGVIMVATIAFGMGIDKPDVRFVAHLNLPKSLEAYYQETGRGGRDGQPANAWMAYNLQDVITLRQMMNDTDANEQYKRVAQHKLETMLGLCELTGCRRQVLLACFDEHLSEPCGNCDNCLHPPVTWDGTEAARKALSCVYRTGQRFGVKYATDVLIGKDDERIKSNRHHRISTYGIGREHSVQAWRDIFRQLIAQGYLDIDPEGYGALGLTTKARPLLRGEMELQLRLRPKREKKQTQRTRKASVVLPSQDQPLFEVLRTLRMQLAKEQGVPPYVIFHDSTLYEMVSHRPDTEAALREVGGVGDRKLARYGRAFLEAIRDHQEVEA
ncbi:MAG TPA: DNA helicase RecQ [Acidiferrobacteraceae bacterium]|nr:DNA helicase RecQ [Acidiferrobacteraceae bacterium]